MANARSRRRFLVDSGKLALGFTLGSSVLGAAACGSGSSSSPLVSPSAWKELARRISGQVLRPGDDGYLETALPNNLRYASHLPAGIAMCQNPNDVAQSILWSRQHAIPLITRSGGHSYAGYSTTRGLMIDVSPINHADYDPSTGIVTIGGGIRNKALYAALEAANATITHGRCTGVGGAAFVLGGGIGFNMRRFGLACDLMVETQLVTADGNIVTANSSENPDLFWACAGAGGGNYGINTEFQLRTFPVSDLTVFNITWTSDPESLYTALIAALQAGPPTLGTRVSLNAVTPEQLKSGTDVSVGLLGQLVGTPDELAEILAPAYAVSTPVAATIQVMPYWQAQIDFLSETGSPNRYQEKSAFFQGVPSAQAIDTAFSWARRWPGTSEQAGMVVFQTGDQVNAIAPDATAFVHRDSDWLMTVVVDWTSKDSDALVRQNLDWQKDFYAAMREFTTGAFVNFIDPTLKSWEQDYYGSNLSRLESIKAAVDPHQVFHFPESIRPGSGTSSNANRFKGLVESA
ncbi:MAG TPA: FAD-binding oxidoreductase [Candidatus Binataceae bacterium]|nr:FAD-binding oxidoreductase [Candidatus Binataceae bacterium]